MHYIVSFSSQLHFCHNFLNIFPERFCEFPKASTRSFKYIFFQNNFFTLDWFNGVYFGSWLVKFYFPWNICLPLHQYLLWHGSELRPNETIANLQNSLVFSTHYLFLLTFLQHDPIFQGGNINLTAKKCKKSSYSSQNQLENHPRQEGNFIWGM